MTCVYLADGEVSSQTKGTREIYTSRRLDRAYFPLGGATRRGSPSTMVAQQRGGVHGVRDGHDGLTDGANNGVWSPDGGWALSLVGHDSDSRQPSGLPTPIDRAIWIVINS